MSEPAVGRRKRPYNAGGAVGGEDRASSFSVSDAHGNSGVDLANRAADHRHSQAVSVGDGNGNDTSFNGAGDESDCSDDDDREVPEILELQSALAYLTSERDVEGIYNRGNKIGSTAQPSNAAATKTSQETDDAQLRRIPNLVNRILMEHYSTNRHTLAGGNAIINSWKQKEKMTQLLLAVVVEFSEPYFARATRRRRRERKELLRLQEERKKQKQEGKKRAREEPQSVRAPPQDDPSAFAFEDRAIAWATSCISQLLQPPAPLSVSSKRKSERDYDSPDDPRISELDALLATSGPHNGLELEEQLQNDDRLLFGLLDPEVIDTILRIKRDDPGAETLNITLGNSAVDSRALARLGQILGGATHVKEFFLWANQVGVVELCTGLQLNHSITRILLYEADLGGNRLRCLDSFLRFNPKLKILTLSSCNLDSTALDLLASALLERSQDYLALLDLSDNLLGDSVGFDRLFQALNRNACMRSLFLSDTGIGSKTCASIAKLLCDPRSTLVDVNVRCNTIEDNGVSLLVDSLKTNADLTELDLSRNEMITSVGWSMLLKVLCNSSTIDEVLKSNHTLIDLGIRYCDETKKAIDDALGSDDATLLSASLEANSFPIEIVALRHKVLWSHARGDLNIGESTLPTTVLPRVLAWVGGGVDDEGDDFFQTEMLAAFGERTGLNYVRYHEHPLPEERMATIKLDSFYRITRSRPELCSWVNASD